MRREDERSGFDEKRWEERGEFIDYLLARAGDANYPLEIRTSAFNLHKELIKYPTLQMIRVKQENKSNTLVDRHFNHIYQTIIHLRQLLVGSNLGDSEFSRILALVHENIKE